MSRSGWSTWCRWSSAPMRSSPSSARKPPSSRSPMPMALSGSGYSYTIGTGGPAVISLLRETLVPRLIGREAEEIEAIWRDLLFVTHATAVGAITSLALAAIDTALWDLRCKRAGLPLWRMAGGAKPAIPLVFHRRRLAAYRNAGAGRGCDPGEGAGLCRVQGQGRQAASGAGPRAPVCRACGGRRRFPPDGRCQSGLPLPRGASARPYAGRGRHHLVRGTDAGR